VRPGGGFAPLDEFAVIEERKRALLKARLAMPYQLQKCATWAQFQRLLRRLPHRPTEMSCTADDVITYLISADFRGRTVVHSIGCRRPLTPPCSCPVRLAFKTVDSTIGRLRSAFRDLGRENQDNPAAARVVKAYLKDITNEQLMVGLVPEQAVPVFSAKLRVVSLAILQALPAAVNAPRFALLRTRAMLLVAMVSLQRGKQLGETKSESIMRFPDDRGLLFNYVYGKTLRSGTKHVFGVLRSEDAVMCPVTALDEYVHGAAKLGVHLAGHGRYLFPPCRDGRVCAGPLKSAQLNADLQYWLTRCQIFNGETMHGIRSGGSIEKSLSGESLHSVMQLAYWKSPKMAKYYMKEWQVLCASVAGAEPPQGTGPLDYARMNEMVGFCVAFPNRK